MQEVGIQWAGDLHVYFMARGYAFVTAHYGKYFNNYMGESSFIHSSQDHNGLNHQSSTARVMRVGALVLIEPRCYCCTDVLLMLFVLVSRGR